MTATLQGKTLFITGASRGIGLAIALRAARDGANIVVVAKTDQPDPRLPGTIHTAVEEINKAGGNGLACACDIRFEEQVQASVEKAVATFGGIDVLINNASAIHLSGTLDTPMKRYDLMHDVNTRGTFLCSQACLPHLLKASNPHILNISPPLNMETRWFAPHLAYTMAKFGMSLCVLGMSGEFKEQGVAVNALWPKTVIATAAVQNLLGGSDVVNRSRQPEIMADAAYLILTRSSRECTGNFFIDEEVLRQAGITGFRQVLGHTRQRPDSRFFCLKPMSPSANLLYARNRYRWTFLSFAADRRLGFRHWRGLPHESLPSACSTHRHVLSPRILCHTVTATAMPRRSARSDVRDRGNAGLVQSREEGRGHADRRGPEADGYRLDDCRRHGRPQASR